MYLFALTAYYRFPAGPVNDALSACGVISVAGAAVRLRHSQVTVGIGHGQPAEHVLVCSLPQGALVLPLNPGPGLLVHVVFQHRTPVALHPSTVHAAGPGWSLHVKGVGHNFLAALQVCSQNEGRSLHPSNYGFSLNCYLRTKRREVCVTSIILGLLQWHVRIFESF